MAKVFVADDNPHVHRMVEETLGAEGHDVACVLDSSDALERIATFKPDIALLDTSLPGDDGVSICDGILARSDLDETRIVMLLGPLEPFDEDDEAQPGVHKVVQKPLDSTILLDLVKDLGSSKSPETARDPVEPDQQVVDELVQEALGRSETGPTREQIREQIEVALNASIPLIVDRITDRLVAQIKQS